MVTNPKGDSDVSAIVTRLDRVDGRIEALTVQVTNFGATMVSRNEINGADERRVLIETFQAHVASNNERFARLESGPQKMLGWISLGVSVVIGAVGCLGTGVAILGTIFAIIWAIAQH